MADNGASLRFWTELLQLPGFEVAHVEQDDQQRLYNLTVIPAHSVGVCPHCSELCDEVHQRRTRDRIRDLPISQYHVDLSIRLPQLWCARCQRAFTPPCAVLAEGAHATERFLERAAQLIRQSDVANAARFFAVPEKTLEDWYYDWVERQQAQMAMPTTPIRRIGIDELSLKKNTASSWR